jgi:hypothetical protein
VGTRSVPQREGERVSERLRHRCRVLGPADAFEGQPPRRAFRVARAIGRPQFAHVGGRAANWGGLKRPISTATGLHPPMLLAMTSSAIGSGRPRVGDTMPPAGARRCTRSTSSSRGPRDRPHPCRAVSCWPHL